MKRVVRIYMDIEVEANDDYEAISEAFNEFEKLIEKSCLSFEEMMSVKILR